MAPERPWKGTVETLGDLRDHGMGLNGHCGFHNCSGSRKLDLDKLIQLFGEEYVYINDEEIGRRYLCTVCGRTGGKVRVIANSTPAGWSPPPH